MRERERERERERRIFSREAKGQFSSTHTQRVTKKKNLPGQKRSPPPLKEAKMVCRSRPLPQRNGRLRGSFPPFSAVLSLSFARRGQTDPSIEARAARGSSDRWDRGRLPSFGAKGKKRDHSSKWEGRDHSNPTPVRRGCKSKAKG